MRGCCALALAVAFAAGPPVLAQMTGGGRVAQPEKIPTTSVTRRKSEVRATAPLRRVCSCKLSMPAT